ncbi:hypothetical protein [Balneatrix alpica]|uniref:hypothetical protein n=1 Tax=Balneatrix alpica TaxID=75684 RepID=UPI00273A0E6C|nr:hypothetical protein [Balneatrix alpica]
MLTTSSIPIDPLSATATELSLFSPPSLNGQSVLWLSHPLSGGMVRVWLAQGKRKDGAGLPQLTYFLYVEYCTLSGEHAYRCCEFASLEQAQSWLRQSLPSLPLPKLCPKRSRDWCQREGLIA